MCLGEHCCPGALFLIRPFNLCSKPNSASENEKKNPHETGDDENILVKMTVTADLEFH